MEGRIISTLSLSTPFRILARLELWPDISSEEEGTEVNRLTQVVQYSTAYAALGRDDAADSS